MGKRQVEVGAPWQGSVPGGAGSELFGDAALCSPEFPCSVILGSLAVRSLLLSLLIFSSLKGVHKVMGEEEVLHKPCVLRGTGWERAELVF